MSTKIARVQMPDGSIARFEVDESTTAEEAEAQAHDQWEATGGKLETANSPPQPYTPPKRWAGAKGGKMVPTPEPKIAAAAQSGVDVTTGAPKGVRSGLGEGFAFDESQARDFLVKELRTKYDPRSTMRKGPVSGEYEYFDPKANPPRWVLFRHSNPFQETLALAGKALPVVGSAADMAVAGNPETGALKAALKAIGLSGMGAAGGEAARVGLGDLAGVNDDVTLGDHLRDIGGEGLATSAGAAAGGIVLGGAKYAKAAISGKDVLSGTEASAIIRGQQKYKGVVEDINKLAGRDIKLPAHLYVDPNDPGAMVGGAMWDKYVRSTSDPKLRYEVAKMDSEEHSWLKNAWDHLAEPFENPSIPPGNQSRTLAGKPMYDANQQAVGNMKNSVTRNLEKSRAKYEGAMGDMPVDVADQMISAGARSREMLMAASKQERNATTEAYKRFNDMIGFDPRTGSTPFKITLDTEKDGPLINAIRDFGKSKYDPTPVPGINEAEDGSMTIDLAALDVVSKRMKTASRRGTSGGSDITITDRDLSEGSTNASRRFSDELEKLEYNGEVPEGTWSQWKTAQAAARNEAVKFKRGILNDFIKTDDDGVHKVSDQFLLSGIIAAKDKQAAQELMDVVGKDPVANREVKNVMWSLYRSRVYNNDIPSAEARRNFEKEYGPLMDVFFGKSEKAKYATLGEVQARLIEADEMARGANKFAKEAFGFSDWKPEQFVNRIMTKGFSSEDAAKLAKAANKFNALEPIQTGVKNEIQSALFKNGIEDQMDLNKLNSLLKDRQGLRIIMGNEFVSNLEKLNAAYPVLRRSVQGMGEVSVNSTFQKGMRAIVRPMSREGNLLRFLSQLRGGNVDKKVYDALMDPHELTRLANQAQVAAMGAKAVTRAGAVGAALYMDEDYVTGQ